MATFTQKANRLEKVRRRLKRHYGEPDLTEPGDPVQHAVRAILGEEATAEQVEAAIDRFREHFAGWNDLRVSRPRETREILGRDFPRAGHKARVLPRLLDQVFKLYNSMKWDFLPEMGKTEARAFFEGLEEVRPFLAATLARDYTEAHAFPVDADIARVLGRLEILDPEEESEAEMQGLLERAVKAPRARELHALVKTLGEDFCVPGEPLCAKCTLRNLCPTGIEKLAKPKKRAAPKKKAKPQSSRKAAAKKTARKKTARKKTARKKAAKKKTAKKKTRKAAKRKKAKRTRR